MFISLQEFKEFLVSIELHRASAPQHNVVRTLQDSFQLQTYLYYPASVAIQIYQV